MTITAVTRNKGWTANDSTFGARLALVRQRMAWGSVAEAARACGQPIESWRTWERDGVEPRRIVAVAKAIAGVTGCDYLWLLLGPEGGETVNSRFRTVTERVIHRPKRPATRPKVRGAGRSGRTTSPERPTQRRPNRVGSPNRAELAAA